MQNRIMDALRETGSRLSSPEPHPSAFVVWPIPLPGSPDQRRLLLIIYQVAYEQARAAVAPSRLLRYLEPIWN
jgi:hypothetical protein